MKMERKENMYFTLLYLSVSMRAVIGQFCGPYSTVRRAKFGSFPSRAARLR